MNSYGHNGLAAAAALLTLPSFFYAHLAAQPCMHRTSLRSEGTRRYRLRLALFRVVGDANAAKPVMLLLRASGVEMRL